MGRSNDTSPRKNHHKRFQDIHQNQHSTPHIGKVLPEIIWLVKFCIQQDQLGNMHPGIPKKKQEQTPEVDKEILYEKTTSRTTHTHTRIQI